MASFKLDENLSPSLKQPLIDAGHDVATVGEQNLRGAPDLRIAEVCEVERRALITADDDFGQILRYPPNRYAGLIVLQHPRPSLFRLRQLMLQVVTALQAETVDGKLWIVEPGRLRIHESDA